MIKTWCKRFIHLLVAAMLCLILFPVNKAIAATPDSYVDDGADLFSDSEEIELSNKIMKIRSKYDADVVIVTVENRGYCTPKQYLDDYFDENYDSGRIRLNTSFIFIDMGDRTVAIRGYEDCGSFITDDRANKILDVIESDLHANKFFDACSTGLDRISHYYGVNTNPLTWIWVEILAALGIGIIVTIVMVSHTKGKITTSSRTYLDQAHSGLTAKRDMYMNTTVRKVHIQQSSSGSGGRSSGGRSSGGHSSSGASRHF